MSAKLHHRCPQGLLAGPESWAERGDKADRHAGGAGGVQRGKMGVAAGTVHEAGAGKGQHFSIRGPASAQLFGCIEQLRRTGAAGQRLAAAVEQQRRGGAGGEADPADVHTGSR